MRHQTLLTPLVCTCLVLMALPALGSAEKRGRDGKLLSVFNIVRFPNDPCGATSNQNGTCYTEQECENRGGTGQGSCASGYGVCCIFSLGCGETSRENITYFESSGVTAGTCSLKVCKCDENICQLRLDFNSFMITGPSTSTLSVGKNNGGKEYTTASKCLTDTFSVTNPGGRAPSTICGINTNEHMYVEASDACNNLLFQLGTAGIGTGLSTRQWNIKVTQYSCNYENLAPKGCTQYFFGSSSGTIQNYNNQGGRHLANQDQNICIRRERSQCRVCYSVTTANQDFAISGKIASMGYVKGTECCAYGTNAQGTVGFDCITIPGAEKHASAKQLTFGHQFCGRTLATQAAGTAAATVCTSREPFMVRFLSDDYEFGTAATDEAGLQSGFKLNYELTSTNC